MRAGVDDVVRPFLELRNSVARSANFFPESATSPDSLEGLVW